MDFADRFRPRSGACFRCFHLRLSGEASQPGLCTPAGAAPSEPGPDTSEIRTYPVLFRKVGIATLVRRSLALRHGSCLLPLKLPFTSHPDDALCDASRSIRILLRPRSHPRAFFPEPSAGNTQSAIVRILFPHPVATPGGCSGNFQVRPEPPDNGLPHWLTVATIGFSPTVFVPGSETTGTWGVTRFAAGLFDRRHLFVVPQAESAYRLTSWSHDAGRSDPPRGSR
jgi:hypothetical protein